MKRRNQLAVSPKWRKSELNAHLKGHTGKPIKCEHCEYSNKDIRNVWAHARVHTDIQSFVYPNF